MAVKIKLKRLGKIRSPHYRIVVADSRTRRDGRAIEEIGLYHPVQNPSRIEVDSERVAYWLSVGAQPTEPVLAILKKTGDWQKFKGEPAPAPLLQPEEKAPRPSFESLAGEDEAKGEAITPKKKAEKKDEAAAESSESTEA
ncbi:MULTISPECIES: 30S ribosomal protein S16 [Streptomyces]|uniref:Small ribosomal subunit protein bS16 n=1 Tax=Streptomyces thermoviolaceus subsp. thermoviolaceus TaxID=66860 RepID=A0ABX0YSV5_STRTL|nr:MULTISPECIES: 30S ribosomal protein S16 [Streptomyces]MCM3264465.1 30S ribosomal protein S16 [Streptomyces thermoviolaceus]NJP14239.1 30S ribosomal protein S16 [Streptomyces thermoviolaceus subsp. thermoviolaceus]RSR99446.1 30S ribosomal protein S16 [Streptomyces sp. WAC00469]WTD47244.1 30S ribosomal protein S16 [Streptomyces thermoviolaceus]GGV79484.1 30S ribosomal protein S16 [Streptomyces thermoviolaceus subsp. apingens]